MPAPLKICFAASEAVPFAKTGGLADVASALPRELSRRGHDVRVFVPLYAQIDPGRHEFHPVDFARDVRIELGGRTHVFSLHTARFPDSDSWLYFVHCPELFHRASLYTSDPDEPERFALFSRAVIESCQRMGWAPDVFHCNDWHSALIPLLLRTVYEWDRLFAASKTLLTIHNIGYQGLFGHEVLERLGLGGWAHRFDAQELAAGRVSFLRTGLIYADVVSTVSPTYAREIQTDEYGMGLAPLLRARRGTLVGILNGVDYREWDPAHDPYLPAHFSRERPEGKTHNKRHVLEQLGLANGAAPPLVGVISRFVAQKGFELAFEVLPSLLSAVDMRLAVLGSGEARYEEFFAWLERQFRGKVCFWRGYSNELAHLIEAGSDMFLMPSRYEPCGLNQLFSLRYGTIPVVRRTGGLADSVEPFDRRTGRGTGFVFEHFTPHGLHWALSQALAAYPDRAAWRRVMDNAMAQDFSWERQAGRYVELYDWLARRRQG